MGAMSPATALLLSGIGGSVGSLGAGLLSSSSAASNNAKALDFNRWSQLQAQEFQRTMYNQQKMDQENFYTKYQSPEAIAKQLQKLGLNPANVLGQGQGLGGSPVSMPSGLSSPALSAPTLENEGTSMAQAIQAIGSSMASIAQAGQTNEQSEEYLNTFNERVNSLILKNNEQELLNAKAQWDLYAAQEKLPYEIQEMVLNAYKLKYEGEYTQSLKALTDIQKYIEEHSKDFTIEQRNMMTTLLGRQIAIAVANENLIKEQGRTELSKQASNYAVASNQREQAQTERDLRTERETALKLLNRVRAVEADKSEATKDNAIMAMLADYARLSSVSEADAAEAQRRLAILRNIEDHTSGEFMRTLDGSIEWLKSKVPALITVK